jgi:DNA polymerase-3 subunit epsilon
VAHRAYRLIRPHGNRFDVGNIRVHGIHPGDVEHEPELPAVWQELRPLLEGTTVLAHNASFDMGVLAASLEMYGLRAPDLQSVCTLAVARRAWPGLPRHGLSDVAAHLGLKFHHHHALEDAEASALIAVRAAADLGLADAACLAEALRRPQPWVTGAVIAPPPAQTARPPRPAPDPAADPSHPLHGRTLVLTGVLRAMTRQEALEAVASVGGRSVASVSAQVDYLVAGQEPGWAKLDRARELRAAGCRIEIIDEDRFNALLGLPQG